MRTSFVSALYLAALAAARPTIHVQETEMIKELDRRQGGGCKEATLIFCRGTMEPGGPVGMLVGTPFSTAVRSVVGGAKLDVQGVKYDAGIMGYLIGGDPAGATTMAKMVSEQIRKCPNSKIIMGGYSQGAQVTHLAAAKLSAEEKSKVVAIVVFGDPYKGKAIAGIPKENIHTICAESDMICWGLPLPIGAHLSYGSDTKNIQAGAQFIKERVAGGGGSSSSGSSGSSGSSAPKGKSSGAKESKPAGGKDGKSSGAKGGKGKEGKESKPKEVKEEPKEETKEEPKESNEMAAHGHNERWLLEETVNQLDGVSMEEYQEALKAGAELERQLAEMARQRQAASVMTS